MSTVKTALLLRKDMPRGMCCRRNKSKTTNEYFLKT